MTTHLSTKITKLFVTSLLLAFFLTVTASAQITTSPAGIAVQGIARDDIGNAIISSPLSLTFEIYYEEGTTTVEIYTVTQNLSTDDYGVFSTTFTPRYNENTLIANNAAFLKISKEETVISDEKLKQVPYAIAASNGVPAGSIMPYIGGNAPAGWVLCDGSDLDDIPANAALIALVGEKAPDLRGMFLRGAGANETPEYEEYIGQTIKTLEKDEFKSHEHTGGGAHEHFSKYPNEKHGLTGIHDDRYSVKYGPTNEEDPKTAEEMRDILTTGGGGHTHGSTGGAETRPANYSVNYIIKQ
jgi:microcystin-dependent protein